MKRRRRFRPSSLRRTTQLLVLVIFFAVLLAARPVPGHPPPAWLGIFFYIDPLILLTTTLAAHAVVAGLFLGLLTVLITAVFGRVFCGWFCPLGTTHAIVGRLFRGRRRRRSPSHWSRWQLAKYVVLIALLTAATLRVSWLMLFDPQVLLYRTATTALWPLTQSVVEESAKTVYDADPGIGSWHVTSVTEPSIRFMRDHVIVTPHQSFLGSGLILAFFLGILSFNFIRPRFWCRYVCPLGGLLGLIAWRPRLRRTVNPSSCNECDLCGMTCPGASSGGPGTAWKPQECLGCLDCVEACPTRAVAFELVRPREIRELSASIDLHRRYLIGAGVAGVAGTALLRISPQIRGAAFNSELIRPPGSREEREFLSRCTGCGMCLKICPTGGLQPTLLEAGLEGIWTPHLAPHIGYCDYECNQCGQVCPTQAIQPLALTAKKEVRIGLASLDISRCLPYAYGRECLVCEEHCPIPDKAIYLTASTVPTRDGGTRIVQQPHVDPARCTGCGICEHVCPFKDRPAIHVTSAGETRHPRNQPILA